MPQVYDKDIKDIKGHMRIESTFEPTILFVVAIHKNDRQNIKQRVPCFRSIPMHGYAYSTLNDSCDIRCINHFHLGMIEIAYEVTIEGTAGWKVRVPLPDTVIQRYLSHDQRLQ